MQHGFFDIGLSFVFQSLTFFAKQEMQIRHKTEAGLSMQAQISNAERYLKRRLQDTTFLKTKYALQRPTHVVTMHSMCSWGFQLYSFWGGGVG